MSEKCVRILAESILWEEGLGKTRIRTTEGLTACMVLAWHGAAQRVDYWEQQLDFFTKAIVGPSSDHGHPSGN